MPDLAKRALDLSVASAVLVAAAPLLAALCLAIRLESPGPAVFRQTRVGRSRKRFETFKLRTMVNDASRAGPQVTAARDPRITRIGRWLRKTKLDELPQLWNVLRGDMSLVGPRPEVPRYVEHYRPEWLRLFNVPPGLTDLASLTFRDEESLLAAAADPERAYRDVIMPMKLQLALRGVDSSSLTFDLAVMLQTLVAIVRGPNEAQEALLAEVRRRIHELEDA